MPKEFEYDGEFKSQGYAYSETYEIQVTLQQTPTNSKLRTGKGNRKWDDSNHNIILHYRISSFAMSGIIMLTVTPQNSLPLINIDILN